MLVVQRDGADGLTIAKVATAADAAVGALYRYFAGKDELLAALQQRAVVAYGTWLGNTIEHAGGTRQPIASLRESVRSWLKFADEEPQLYALIDASMSNPTPTLSQRSARLVDLTLQKHVMSHIFGLLAAAVAAGDIQPG
ncbi:MAG: AcrR family transcriptional regulator, partial [Kiritimatiellia bacterium]